MSIDITNSPPISQNGKAPVATHTVYLALGSNMGDRRGNLAAALQRLRDVMEISTISSIYETEPVGYLDQPRFLNAVCRGKTAQELLNAVSQVGVQRLEPGLRIALDRDIQSGQPAVHVRLGRTGVVGITKAILIGDQEGQQQWFNAAFDLYASLDASHAGVHMSRFSDALDEVMEDIGNNAS